MTNSAEELTCQELVELVTSYFEGALADGDRVRFERHLAECDGCQNYLEQMRKTIELVGSLAPTDVEPDAEARLLAAFRKWKATSPA